MNYKKMSFITGIVIFFGVIIIMLSIIGLAEKQLLFSNEYIIYVKFSDIIGLQEQAPVFMRGFRIGWTKGVEFKKDGVIVRIDINKNFKIPDDSKFELNTVSLLGEKAITINSGVSDTYFSPEDLALGENKDIIREMKSVLGLVKTKLDTIEFEENIIHLSESITYLHSILKNVDKKINQVNVDSYNKQIENIGTAAKRISQFVEENNANVKNTFSILDTAALEFTSLMKEVNQITDKINNGDGSAAGLLNDKKYIENLNQTILEVKNFLTDIQQNPKKYIHVSVF